MDLRYEAIARNLNISLGTAYNIFKLCESTGEVDRSPEETTNWMIIKFWTCTEFPSSTALRNCRQSIAKVSGTVVSTSTKCRLLASHGSTRKKIQHVALQRCLDLRGSLPRAAHTQRGVK